MKPNQNQLQFNLSSNLVKFIASLTNSSLMQAFVEGSWMIMSKKNEVENRHMSAVLSL